MGTLNFGLVLMIIPFTAIFLFLIMAWSLVDISVRKNLSGRRKALWGIVVILFPVVGALLYNAKVRLPDLEGKYREAQAPVNAQG